MVVAGDDTFRVDLLFFHRRLRGLKVAPEDVEIETVEPVERAARAVELALAGQQGDMKHAGPVQPGPEESRPACGLRPASVSS